MERMVGPLCGFDKSLAFSLRDAVMPRLHVVVGQLVAVHRLIALEHPLSYHIGGYGVYAEEALIRALGETLERYAHMAITSWSSASADTFPSSARQTPEGGRKAG